MAWDSCRAEVEGTGDKMCNVNECAKAQSGIDHRCHSQKWPAGYPFAIYHDDGSLCFCCCSCFQYNTPIKVPGGVKMIQDFVPGDPVLAAGLSLQWKEAHVDLSSGIEPNPTGAWMTLVRWGTNEASEQLTVTDDHLFLLANKTLMPASALKAGDLLMRPDGSTVAVLDAHEVFSTNGVHHISTGPWNGNIDGHLLDSNNVVTTDMVVKVAALTGGLPGQHLHADLPHRHKVGSAEYEASYSESSRLFRSDPTQWPMGTIIVPKQALVVIPKSAAGYLTEHQARWLAIAKTPRRDYDSSAAIESVRYVFAQLKVKFSKPTFLLDWANSHPNAYAFSYFNQDFVVVTGGLARIALLQNQGIAMICCQLLARLYGTNPCVGPADYAAVDNFAGLYQAIQFPDQLPKALAQLAKLFALIKWDDSADRCKEPTPTCRVATYWAGANLDPLPRCADPGAEDFGIISVAATTVDIVVEYNDPVDTFTATAINNYALTPAATITKAEMDADSETRVRLAVDLIAGTGYRLDAVHILSANDEPIDPSRSGADFKVAK
jgi:hypothetical protein